MSDLEKMVLFRKWKKIMGEQLKQINKFVQVTYKVENLGFFNTRENFVIEVLQREKNKKKEDKVYTTIELETKTVTEEKLLETKKFIIETTLYYLGEKTTSEIPGNKLKPVNLLLNWLKQTWSKEKEKAYQELEKELKKLNEKN